MLKPIFIKLVILISVFGNCCYSQNPYPAWQYSAAININTTANGANIGAGVSETNFPILVKIGSGYFNFTQTKTEGEDIRFANATGTPLPYEIQSWDGQNGDAWIWVLADQIQGNTSQNITMYWGNATANSESNSSTVFDTSKGFMAVWHLDDNGNNDSNGYKDATQNSLHGTGTSMSAFSDVSAVVGKGQIFDGSEDRINIPQASDVIGSNKYQNLDDFSIEHWINISSPPSGLEGILMSGSGGGWVHYQWKGSKVGLLFGQSTGATSYNPGIWYHMTLTYDKTNQKLRHFSNGVMMEDLDMTRNSTDLNRTFTLGAWTHGITERYNDGIYDEFRISSTVRSPDWIKLSYENQKPDQTLVSLPKSAGCIENFSVPQATVNGSEGQIIVIQGNAFCADRLYWAKMNGNLETPISGNLPLVLEIGRISKDSTINLRLKALYGTQWRNADVTVNITQSVVNPIFTLPSPLPQSQNWTGRTPLEIVPTISNLIQIQTMPSPFNLLNYNWNVPNMGSQWHLTNNQLYLDYAYSRDVKIDLCLDNGADPVCQSLNLATDIPNLTTQLEGNPIKIFILAGQSNMEGHGALNFDPQSSLGIGSLEYMAWNTKSPEEFEYIIGTATGGWYEREDVWIKYDGNMGKLKAGYGVSHGETIGPELGFGTVTGNQINEQIVLLKVASGGKALATAFRPPSSGSFPPPQTASDTGWWYKQIVDQTNDLVANLSTYFPSYNGQGYEIVGFGWHQGWNDLVNAERTAEYTANMANLIRDLRNDLNVPNLPFVIAESGMACQNGDDQFCQNQLAPASMPEFQGTVAGVRTRDFYYDQPGAGFHWNQNGESYLRIGKAMGDAMMGLLDSRPLILLTPNGGEKLAKGSTYSIAWLVKNNLTAVKLEYQVNGGAWQPIAQNINAADGSYAWTLPNSDLSDVIVRVSNTDGSIFDQSNAGFGVVTPVLSNNQNNLIFHVIGGLSYSIPSDIKKIQLINVKGGTITTVSITGPTVFWDGKNEKGQQVKSGIYFAKLIGLKTKTLKILLR